MRLSEAARVGLAVMAALGVLAFVTFWLRGSVGFGGFYTQQVAFESVQGLQEGAYVRVRGVEVGRVDNIGLGPDGRPLVTLRLRDPARGGYRIRRSDSIRITGGLLGFTQPWVEITPRAAEAPRREGTSGPRLALAGKRPPPRPEETDPEVPAEGEVLEGETGQDVSRLIDRGEELLDSLTRLSERMNRLTETVSGTLDDPQLRRDLKRTASNFAEASERGVVVARNMERVTARADRLIASFQGTSEQLSTTLRRADTLIASLRGTARETQAMMADTRGLVQDTRSVVRETGQVVRQTGDVVQDAGQTFKNTAALVQDTRATLAENRERLAQLFRGLDRSLEQLNATLAEARAFVGDSELRQDLKATADNAREATQNLKKITADVETLTGDPEVQEDLRVTLSNLRDATEEAAVVFRRVREVLGTGGEKARSVADRLRDTTVIPEVVHGVRSERTRFDVNATIPWSANQFYRFGVYDLGESNRFNAQAGSRVYPGVWARYGFHHSKFGLGLDVGDPVKAPFQVDLYGFRRPQVDVRGNIPIARYLDLTLGLDNVTRRPDPLIGIRFRK